MASVAGAARLGLDLEEEAVNGHHPDRIPKPRRNDLACLNMAGSVPELNEQLLNQNKLRIPSTLNVRANLQVIPWIRNLSDVL